MYTGQHKGRNKKRGQMIITKNQLSFMLVVPYFSLTLDIRKRYNKTTCACHKGIWAAEVNLNSLLTLDTRCRSMLEFTPQLFQGQTDSSIR
jgi:hypothetical protein